MDLRRTSSEAAPAAPAAAPRLWAVAGGKGGVGKSVVAANLGVALARRGLRCALVDLDLGGANLHTLLGVERPPRTLADFVAGDSAELSEVLGPTEIPGLVLASGDRAPLDVAHPRHFQKLKLLRHLRRLPADVVLLDLAAGSGFHALDFFLAADRGILVTVPEPTAVENTYQFMRAAFYRSLRDAARAAPVKPAIRAVLERLVRSGVRTPRELIEAVGATDPEAGRALAERAHDFAPLLIVNRTHAPEHRALGPDMTRASRQHLGAQVAYAGLLERDECVREAVEQRRPVLALFPRCAFSRGLQALAGRLLSDGHLPERSGAGPPEPQRAPRPERPAAAAGDARPPGPGRPARLADLLASRPPAPVGLRRDDGAGAPRALPEPALEALVEGARVHVLAVAAASCPALPREPLLRSYLREYARALGDCTAGELAERFLRRYGSATGR